jgi:hypothetical protein
MQPLVEAIVDRGRGAACLELNPALLPDDFSLPTGSPACGCRWLAFVH